MQKTAKAAFQQEIAPYLGVTLRKALDALPEAVFESLTEIRLGTSRPVTLQVGDADWILRDDGKLAMRPEQAFKLAPEDLGLIFELLVSSSVYAFEDALRSCYVTLPGGHRVGFCGTCVTEGGRIRSMKHVSSLNIRVARDLPGVSLGFLPHLVTGRGQPASTLVVSPPACGKTTLLRDIVKHLSDGVPSLGIGGFRVCVIDERSEIASCRFGTPQRDVGARTDVLDGCPKSEGMLLALRTMSPQVMATDELGSEADSRALVETVRAGVSVICTAHGRGVEEVMQRPSFSLMRERTPFSRAIVLSSRLGPGTVELVLDVSGGRELMTGPFRPSTRGAGQRVSIEPSANRLHESHRRGSHHRRLLALR